MRSLLLLFPALLFAVDQPADMNAAHERLIKEGIALHVQRRFDEAIAKYTEVLKQDPQNAAAWYELSASQQASGNYTACVNSATEGLKYKGRSEALLYGSLGTCHDLSGRANEAIAAFRNGIRVLPAEGMLHYNLAVTLARAGRNDDARAEFRESLKLQPRHAGSHFALATTYLTSGYRIPAFLAALTALTLEPGTPRSRAGFQMIQRCMNTLVTSSSNGRGLQFNLAPESKNDEGEFVFAETTLGIGVSPLGHDPNVSQFAQLATTLAQMCKGLDPSKCSKDAFACRFYVPFFTGAAKQGLADALLASALGSASIPGRAEWAAANEAKVASFRDYMKSYVWRWD